MRQFFQGTLDYACGLYAVLNALALTHDVDLPRARHIYQQTICSLARVPRLWDAFMYNRTDHYWLVAYMLRRWCRQAPYRLHMIQPFSTSIVPFTAPCAKEVSLDHGSARDCEEAWQESVELYSGEDSIESEGQVATKDRETQAVWDALHAWLCDEVPHPRAALLRFHRFLPSVRHPVVSHWTTVRSCNSGYMRLFDASAEHGSIQDMHKEDTLIIGGTPPALALVPSSLVLLENVSYSLFY